MTIAILAMQGAFLEHGQMLDRLGVDHFEIRKKEDLDRSFDGLILPGGESTVMRKVENSYGRRTGLIHHSEKKKDNSR